MSAPKMDDQARARLLEKLDRAVDLHSEGALDLLNNLIAINSINPNFPGVMRKDVIGGESGCTELIGQYLSARGFEVNRIAPDPERINVAAVKRGRGAGRSLIVNGHVDTVAPFEPNAWTSKDPWKPTRRDSELYGLGSTDMKGGLAAACLAAAALSEAGVELAGDLQIHAVVGEETMDHELGTTAVLRAGFKADAAIVVEASAYPVPLMVAPVSAGNFNLKISVKGRGTHAGNRGAAIRAGGEGAAAGVNAVEKLIKVVQSLQDLEQEWGISKQHPAFPSGLFSLVPGVFHGDVGVPSVGYMADFAYAGYLVWYSPNETPEAVKAEIAQHVHHAAQLDPWLRENPPRLEWLSNWPVAEMPDDHPLIATLLAAREGVLGNLPAGIRPTASFNAVSDASFLQLEGVPATVFGPGNLKFAHAVDEHIDLDEWRAAARVLARTMLDWCGMAD